MVNLWPQQPKDDLRIDTAWRENYTSASLNKKFAGVIPKGVYQGFSVTPGSGLSVRVGSSQESKAILLVNGYSLTASMPAKLYKTVNVAAGTRYIVIDASYAEDQQSTVVIKAVTSINANHLVLAKVVVPSGSTSVRSSMITFAERHDDVIAKISDLEAHKADNSNPHGVTKTQVGLSNVPNYPATGSLSDGSPQKLVTADATKELNTKKLDKTASVALKGDIEGSADFGGTNGVTVNTKFDAARYAVPTPDFHLPLINDIHIKEGVGLVTFSRSSVKRYISKTGGIKVAGIDEPAHEARGLLIEGSSTNYLVWSENLDKATKQTKNVKINSIRKGEPYPLSNEISWSDRKSYGYLRFSIGGPKVEGVITVSVFIKHQPGAHIWLGLVARNGRGYVERIRRVNLEVGDDVFKTEYICDGMYRVWTTYDCGKGVSGASSGIEVMFHSKGGVEQHAPIYVGGWQVEKKTHPTSYILTKDAIATRAGDQCLFDVENLKKSGYTMALTLSVNNNMSDDSGYFKVLSQKSGSPNYLTWNMLRINGGTVRHYVNDTYVAASVSERTPTRVAVTYGEGATTTDSKMHCIFRDGKLIQSENSALRRDAEYNPKYGFGAGSNTSKGAYHIRNMRIWHKVLTEKQIAAVGE